MRPMHRFVMPALALALFFGTIGISQATGTWVTSGRQQVASGAPMTTADLKGWMTLDHAAAGLGMPVDDLVAIIGAPSGAVTGATAFKEVETIVPGFSLTTFRAAVQARLDAPPKG